MKTLIPTLLFLKGLAVSGGVSAQSKPAAPAKPANATRTPYPAAKARRRTMPQMAMTSNSPPAA